MTEQQLKNLIATIDIEILVCMMSVLINVNMKNNTECI